MLMKSNVAFVQLDDSRTMSFTNLGFGCLLPYNISQQMVFGVLHFVLVHPQVLPRHWALGVAAETPPLEIDLVKGLPYIHVQHFQILFVAHSCVANV